MPTKWLDKVALSIHRWHVGTLVMCLTEEVPGFDQCMFQTREHTMGHPSLFSLLPASHLKQGGNKVRPTPHSLRSRNNITLNSPAHKSRKPGQHIEIGTLTQVTVKQSRLTPGDAPEKAGRRPSSQTALRALGCSCHARK